MQNAPREHSAILLTFNKLPFVFKIFVLSVFEWPLKTGFTVMSFYGIRGQFQIWEWMIFKILWYRGQKCPI